MSDLESVKEEDNGTIKNKYIEWTELENQTILNFV